MLILKIKPQTGDRVAARAMKAITSDPSQQKVYCGTSHKNVNGRNVSTVGLPTF